MCLLKHQRVRYASLYCSWSYDELTSQRAQNDDEEAGSSEHSDDDGKDTTPRQRRRQEKFTRAKRNRLARTKAARRLAEEAKKAAAFNAQIERCVLSLPRFRSCRNLNAAPTMQSGPVSKAA